MTAPQQAPEQPIDYKAMVQARVDEVLIDHGYAKTRIDGEVVKDLEKMKARAYDVVVAAVVNSKADRSKKAITQGELYAAVFPKGPGADPPDLDSLEGLELDVRSSLVRMCWNLTQPKSTGFIQKRIGDGSLILCRTNVYRKLDEVQGVFVTDSPQLIMEDSLQPQIDKLVRTASDLRTHAVMITGRHPELETKVSTALGAGFTRVRNAAQLPATTGNGKKPVMADKQVDVEVEATEADANGEDEQD
jgi:hypothetical protein